MAEEAGSFDSTYGPDVFAPGSGGRVTGPLNLFQKRIGWYVASLADVCDALRGPTTVIVDALGDRLPWRDEAWVDEPWSAQKRRADSAAAGLNAEQVDLIDAVALDMHTVAARRRGTVTLVLTHHPVVEAALLEYAAYRVDSQIDVHQPPDGSDPQFAPTMSVSAYDSASGVWRPRVWARTGPFG